MLLTYMIQALFKMGLKYLRKYLLPITIGVAIIALVGMGVHQESEDVLMKGSGSSVYEPLKLIHRELTCSKWAVTASQDEIPSEGIRRFLYDPSWCLVIVKIGDASKFKISTTIGSNIFVFDEEEQQKMRSQPFLKDLPLTLSARRNIGYLFAIAHNARMIFDFDPWNEIKFWMPNALPSDNFASLNHFENPKASDFVSLELGDKTPNCPIYDPYATQYDPVVSTKTRVPSDCMSFNDFLMKDASKGKVNIGILHSKLDHVKSVRNIKVLKSKAGLLLPKGIFYPYGTESSIYYPSMFWSLYVPTRVKKGEAEILRCYIVKFLCDFFNIEMGFVNQPLTWLKKRNIVSPQKEKISFDIHNLIKDLSSFKEKQEHDKDSKDIILDLWEYLYQSKYIQKEDLNSVRAWIQILLDLNYRFPGRGEPKGKSFLRSNKVGNQLSSLGKTISNTPKTKCKVRKSKAFWTSDLHDGCRADFPLVLAELNQTVWVSGIKQKKNRFGIFNYPGIRYSDKLSPTVQKINSHSTRVSKDDIKINADYYAKNPIEVDGFFCGFPASMCEIWIPLKKSIIFVPAHRYNLGRCSIVDWKRLNQNLGNLNRKNNAIGALSRYDLEYMDHYTNLLPTLFPSYSGVYLRNYTYKPTFDRVLYMGLGGYVNLQSKEAKRQNIVSIKPYTLEDLIGSRAIIYLAYSVMSYKLTEFYNMGIPLLMPSLQYYRQFGFGEDRTSTSSNYCNDLNLNKFPSHPDSAHPFNPNLRKSEDSDSETYWLQFSDFYDWPYILHFDNLSHIHHLIDTTNFSRISAGMLQEVQIRKDQTYNAWCNVINQM